MSEEKIEMCDNHATNGHTMRECASVLLCKIWKSMNVDSHDWSTVFLNPLFYR